jgi:AraC family transcriptional activator of pobA
MKKDIPVLQIESFHKLIKNEVLYVNRLSNHLLENKALISHPHKHDFYLTVFFHKGMGMHEIDFERYSIQAGSVFLMKPGQTHHWELSADCEGYIIFHTDFLSQNQFSREINDFPFYNFRNSNPEIKLIDEKISEINDCFKRIFEEFNNELNFKFRKIYNLIDNLYIDFSRLYDFIPNSLPTGKSNYLEKLNKLESLIENNYKLEKSPNKYAEMLFISPKHLNRIVRETLNKTTSELIRERIILETKRLISHSTSSLSEISIELGFEEFSYFSRFFKKKTGKTLSEFKKELKAKH